MVAQILTTLRNQALWQEITLRSFKVVAIAIFVSFRMTGEQAPVASIGGVSELNGTAEVLRDIAYEAELDFAINSNDQAVTRNGRMAITFLDDSKVRLTEHSKLVINEYIFDPDPSKAKMALNFARGTARFITSELGLINKQNISLSTPTAQITIRGTDFTCTVDELGRSLIILLPDDNGLPSGEILVTTAMGQSHLTNHIKPLQLMSLKVHQAHQSYLI